VSRVDRHGSILLSAPFTVHDRVHRRVRRDPSRRERAGGQRCHATLIGAALL